MWLCFGFLQIDWPLVISRSNMRWFIIEAVVLPGCLDCFRWTACRFRSFVLFCLATFLHKWKTAIAGIPEGHCNALYSTGSSSWAGWASTLVTFSLWSSFFVEIRVELKAAFHANWFQKSCKRRTQHIQHFLSSSRTKASNFEIKLQYMFDTFFFLGWHSTGETLVVDT